VRGVAVLSASASLVVSVMAWLKFDGATGGWDSMQLVERASWIPTFGIQYALGMDGLSMPWCF
jgi:NADH-quinone oxidoreductase subunit M